MNANQAAAVEVALAIAEAIRAMKSVPSGHLYARVMDKMSLQTYESIIDSLVRTGLVARDSSHVLTWVGKKS